MKNIFKIIGKSIYTLLVAISLGLATSFGYKTSYKEADKEKMIEGKK
jgi:hypothetical protein